MERRSLSCRQAAVVRWSSRSVYTLAVARPTFAPRFGRSEDGDSNFRKIRSPPAARIMIEITSQPIDPAAVHRRLHSPEAGASVVFTGTTRRLTEGRETVELTYECYRELAERKLRELEVAARIRWSLVECVILHRLGVVPLGQASVVVGVSAAHREAAFAAARWLIDTLKEQVPIWKQEHWADGTREWIHPGMSLPGAASGGNPDAG